MGCALRLGCGLLLAAALCGAGLSSSRADTLVVGPAGVPGDFAQAVRRARDGDVIEVLPGEYRGVVAVIGQRKLTIRGVGARPVFLADGKVAEGKAMIVVRDGDIVLENLEFRGARAPDANGAGVRFERGRLQVRRCVFLDNQMGLLTANFGDAQLDVVDSEFGDAPKPAGGLTHLLYVGRIARFSVSGSRFHGGHDGHLIKSRARESLIAYNMIHDGPRGSASYEVDLPNGGAVTLIGNVIAQSPRTRNAVLVSYGEEGQLWDRSVLRMSHNTLINEAWTPARFLRVATDRLPKLESVVAINNLVVGLGTFGLTHPGAFHGNWAATLGMLRDPPKGQFELRAGSWLRDRGIDPRDVEGGALQPRAEFQWPLGTEALSATPQGWSPGAYQR